MTDRFQPIRLRIDRDSILAYAEMSNDFNPIHVDPDYAAKTPFGGVIAHGALSLNLIWRWVEQAFGAPVACAYVSETRFRAPVRENDVVEAGGAPAPDGGYRVWVRNQDGVEVIEGSLTLFGPQAQPTPEPVG